MTSILNTVARRLRWLGSERGLSTIQWVALVGGVAAIALVIFGAIAPLVQESRGSLDTQVGLFDREGEPVGGPGTGGGGGSGLGAEPTSGGPPGEGGIRGWLNSLSGGWKGFLAGAGVAAVGAAAVVGLAAAGILTGGLALPIIFLVGGSLLAGTLYGVGTDIQGTEFSWGSAIGWSAFGAISGFFAGAGAGSLGVAKLPVWAIKALARAGGASMGEIVNTTVSQGRMPSLLELVVAGGFAAGIGAMLDWGAGRLYKLVGWGKGHRLERLVGKVPGWGEAQHFMQHHKVLREAIGSEFTKEVAMAALRPRIPDWVAGFLGVGASLVGGSNSAKQLVTEGFHQVLRLPSVVGEWIGGLFR